MNFAIWLRILNFDNPPVDQRFSTLDCDHFGAEMPRQRSHTSCGDMDFAFRLRILHFDNPPVEQRFSTLDRDHFGAGIPRQRSRTPCGDMDFAFRQTSYRAAVLNRWIATSLGVKDPIRVHTSLWRYEFCIFTPRFRFWQSFCRAAVISRWIATRLGVLWPCHTPLWR